MHRRHLDHETTALPLYGQWSFTFSAEVVRLFCGPIASALGISIRCDTGACQLMTYRGSCG